MSASTFTTRRNFIKTGAIAAAAFSIVPARAVAGLGHQAPSDKLNIAAIGIGGVGFRNINNLSDNNIVALCDVDSDYAQKAFRRWSAAKQYTDFRRLFDDQKGIDAVVIATPDHTHAVAAITAMQLQKHVFVQSPMAHAVFEARRMTETAQAFNVVSQVGNQGASGDDVRIISEILWNGTIGEVREVQAWTTAPMWKQGIPLPDKKMREPNSLDWNTFLGPASYVPYHASITPYGWRSWYNFGGGALAMMAPHVLHPVFSALQLKAPVKVQTSSSWGSMEAIPATEHIIFHFERRDNLPKLAMPEMKLTWYDGGLLPERPAELPEDLALGDMQGGLIFKGDKGLLVCGTYGSEPKLIIDGVLVETVQKKVIHRIPNPYNGGHEADWVRACKESSENRLQPAANFESQLALTETVCVGNMAARLQSLNKTLMWDSAQMNFTNIGLSEEIVMKTTGDLFFENNVSKFKVEEKRYNARKFVENSVRPIYRDGWQQV